MSLCWLVVIVFVIFAIDNVAQNEKTTINVYAITTSFSVGESLERGHQIAMDILNEDPNILSEYYYFNLTVLKSGDDPTHALLHALEISYDNNNDDNDNISYTIPIVLACDWSVLSTVTAPTLSAFEWAQISSSSTSSILSKTSAFSYFYRTIPNDELQAHSLIYLCNTFNWTQIGIIHVNDNYGVYLAVSISELATLNSIEVNSIAFERNKNESYDNAVLSMKEIGVYIIIIISHGDNDIKQLFKALNTQHMLQYPYFYIASDGWLDAKVIQNITNDFTNYQGIIGTLPWQPINTNKTDLLIKKNLKANILYNEIQQWYSRKYGNNSSPMGTRLIYGYDTAMVFIRIVEKLHHKYGTMWWINFDSQDIITFISDIILNEIEFQSVTGLVSFNNDTGDRNDGLYSFGFITSSGEIECFGYSYFKIINNSNANANATTSTSKFKFISVINKDLIIWPKVFENKNIIPQSSSFITNKVSLINKQLFISITIFCCICTVCIILWAIVNINRNRNRNRNKLDLIIYIGVIMAYVNVIISGLDEGFYANDKRTLDILCNVRVWFMVLSFTLCLTPIFAKTYRLSRIFTELLITKRIADGVLLLRIFVAVCIDLMLLLIFTSLSPFERIMKEGDVYVIDELQSQQYIYGDCSISITSISSAFFVCICVWKFMELIFGIYVSIIVSRMSFKSQRWIMTIIVVILCIDIVLISFGPTDKPSFTYLVFSLTTILIMNVIVFERYFIKLKIKYDIKTNENTTYTQEDIELDDERKMKKLLKLRLQEIAKAENWANEMSSTKTNINSNSSNMVQD